MPQMDQKQIGHRALFRFLDQKILRKMKWLFNIIMCQCSFVAINTIEQNLVPELGCHYKQKAKTGNTGLWTQQ